MTTETFIHRFPKGITATAKVQIGADGRPVHIACLWNKDMTPKRIARILPEYQIWQADYMRTLAEKYRWGNVAVIHT